MLTGDPSLNLARPGDLAVAYSPAGCSPTKDRTARRASPNLRTIAGPQSKTVGARHAGDKRYAKDKDERDFAVSHTRPHGGRLQKNSVSTLDRQALRLLARKHV